MKIRCICVVRDEADVLPFTLDAALEWAHAIHVVDNGSTDGTWELLADYSAADPRVVVAGREMGMFRNAFRGRVANAVRAEAESGDWWCRLDADEIYVDSPPDLLARLGPREMIVNSISLDYLFTDEDLARFEESPADYLERWRPELHRYYLAYWSEPRFVRHIPGREWVGAWPRGFRNMPAAAERLRIRHYQYRSPPQIERRLRTRVGNTEGGAFPHEKAPIWNPTGRLDDLLFRDAIPASESWRTRVVKADALRRDLGDGAYQVEWDRLPEPQRGTSMLQRAVGRVRRLIDRAASFA